MMIQNEAIVVRNASLVLPVAATLALWVWRQPTFSERTGILLACIWNLCGLLILHELAQWQGWWGFHLHEATFRGLPVDLYLGWIFLWGAIPSLAFPRVGVLIRVLIMLGFDLLVMPLCSSVVQLSHNWIVGEVVAITICLWPSQLLMQWTKDGTRLSGRASLQLLCYIVFAGFILPDIVFENKEASLEDYLRKLRGADGIHLQMLFLLSVPGITAVTEFVTRGQGTPLPYDPPQKLVVSGPYAYVANPMQLSSFLCLTFLGYLVSSYWVVGTGLMAFIYSAGLAAWDEGADLDRKFGDQWRAYKGKVHLWLPCWKPYVSPFHHPAKLYFARSCGICSELGVWIASRQPTGLQLLTAESHPLHNLERLTYDPQDGSGEQQGMAALARVFEHIHLGWAFVGWIMRLPGLCWLLQLVVDAVGGGPRLVSRQSIKK